MIFSLFYFYFIKIFNRVFTYSGEKFPLRAFSLPLRANLLNLMLLYVIIYICHGKFYVLYSYSGYAILKERKEFMIPNDNATVKHTVKDSVFKDVFSIPENVLELYRTFHPEDSSVTVEDIQISTLSSIIINRLINDLGFYVKKNGKAKFVILVEEQSYWNPNITFRMFGYLVDTLNRYLYDTDQNVHTCKKVSLPEIELYVIYAGNCYRPPIMSSNRHCILSRRQQFCQGKCTRFWKVSPATVAQTRNAHGKTNAINPSFGHAVTKNRKRHRSDSNFGMMPSVFLSIKMI